jgi:hypothetical protein
VYVGVDAFWAGFRGGAAELFGYNAEIPWQFVCSDHRVFLSEHYVTYSFHAIMKTSLDLGYVQLAAGVITANAQGTFTFDSNWMLASWFQQGYIDQMMGMFSGLYPSNMISPFVEMPPTPPEPANIYPVGLVPRSPEVMAFYRWTMGLNNPKNGA